MPEPRLQTGLRDLSELGAVFECECRHAVVVPRRVVCEYGPRAGIRHISDGHHTYERPKEA